MCSLVGALTLQSLPHRCPCPCMVVPMTCLQLFSGSSGASTNRMPQMAPSGQSMRISEQVMRIAKRAKPGPINIRLRRGRQRTRSLDADDYMANDARVLEVIADEDIELEAIEELDLEESEVSGREKTGNMSPDEVAV